MRRFVLILFALCLGGSARAEELSCTLSVEPREVRVGDQVTVELEVRGQTDVVPAAVLTSALPGSLTVASTSSAMSMQIVAGVTTTTRTARLVAIAGKATKLKVGPVRIGTASCKAVALRVRPAPKGGAAKSPPAEPGGAAPEVVASDIRPSVEPSELRVGTEAVLRYDLSSVSSRLRRVLEAPVTEGAFVELADGPSGGELRLVPLWPGQFSVGPLSLEVGGDPFWGDRRTVVATQPATFEVAQRTGPEEALAAMQASTPGARETGAAGVAVLLVRPGADHDVELALRLARALGEAGMELAVVSGTAPSTVVAGAPMQADQAEASVLDAQKRELAGRWPGGSQPISSTTVLVGAAEALTRPGPRVLVAVAPLQCAGAQLGCRSLWRTLKLLGVELLRPDTADEGAPGIVVQLGPEKKAVAALVARVRRVEAADPLWKDLAGTWVPEMLEHVRDTALTASLQEATPAPPQDL